MPIYAYRCASCGHQQDVLQKMSDARLVDCPACGKPTFEKQVTAAGFQLKGSGWYVTDFRDTGKKESAKSGGDAAPGESAAPGDAKPAEGGSKVADGAAPPPASTPTPAAAAAAPAATPAKSPPAAGST